MLSESRIRATMGVLREEEERMPDVATESPVALMLRRQQEEREAVEKRLKDSGHTVARRLWDRAVAVEARGLRARWRKERNPRTDLEAFAGAAERVTEAMRECGRTAAGTDKFLTHLEEAAGLDEDLAKPVVESGDAAGVPAEPVAGHSDQETWS